MIETHDKLSQTPEQSAPEVGDAAARMPPEAIRLTDTSMSVVGKVVFMRSDDGDRPCVCCKGNHIFNVHIDFDSQPSPVWDKSFIERFEDIQFEALHHIPNIEGKFVRVTVEVIQAAASSEGRATTHPRRCGEFIRLT